MQLVQLSADGRVVAEAATPVPGPLRVALELDAVGVRVVALGPVPRPVGRLSPTDAADYVPVLRWLAGLGLVGSCPARVAPRGALVLDLAPAATCVFNNFPGDLVLLPAQRTVTVTREEHHQNVLVGRAGRVAVALAPCTIASGKYAGRRGIEVTLDGQRAGELTRLMSDRYLPIIDEVRARGRRAGCEALLRSNPRGVQVELRLPAVDANARPDAAASTAAASTAVASTAVVPAPRPAPSHPTAIVPVPQPPPTVVAPVPVRPWTPAPAPVPANAEPRARRGRRGRRIMWAGASVIGVLILAGAVGNNAKPDTAATATPAAEQRVVAAPTSTSAGASGAARSSTAPVNTSRVAPGVGDAASAERTIRTTTPTTTRTTNVKPAPRSTAAERTTTTRRSGAPTEGSSGCDPNYSGCVPIASDVDCEGGSGNGPAYVTGPVRIVGTDIYGLDGGGKPGIGCE